MTTFVLWSVMLMCRVVMCFLLVVCDVEMLLMMCFTVVSGVVMFLRVVFPPQYVVD